MPRNETLAQAIWRLEAERERGGPFQGQDVPDRLGLDQIKICPKVFQPRVDAEPDGTCSAGFVEQLAGHLRNKPEAERFLDPLLVWAAGRKAYIVNGHHRLAAYKAAGLSGPVPVEFFAGTLSEARQAAIEDGAKSRLNFDTDDRNEAAWRLVVMDKRGEARLTVQQMASLSGMSPRSIDRMRQLYVRLQDTYATTNEWTGEPDEAEFESYAEARSKDRGHTSSKDDVEGWLEEMAQRWAERLGSEFGKEPHRKPEVFARALEIYLGENAAKRVATVWDMVEIDGDEHEALLEWRNDQARAE